MNDDASARIWHPWLRISCVQRHADRTMERGGVEAGLDITPTMMPMTTMLMSVSIIAGQGATDRRHGRARREVNLSLPPKRSPGLHRSARQS